MILASDTDKVDLSELDKLFDTGEKIELKEGRRVWFFEGKRKLKDGTTKKTGHHYWGWSFKDPDTGKRKRPYGGRIDTVPNLYQYRRRQYEAVVSIRGSKSLAEHLFRPTGITMPNFDTDSK